MSGEHKRNEHMRNEHLIGPYMLSPRKGGHRTSGSPLRTDSQQSGMVLLLCLIFMTALTLLGLSTSSDTILQKQLASNLRDAEYARQTAHLSLQWAEQWISQQPANAMASCEQDCSGFYTHANGNLDNDLQFQPMVTWLSLGFEAGVDPDTGGRLQFIGPDSAEPPMWLIEYLHHSPALVDNNVPGNSIPEQDWFRILVRGTGRSDNTVSVIESVIVRIADDSGQTPPTVPTTERVSWRQLR